MTTNKPRVRPAIIKALMQLRGFIFTEDEALEILTTLCPAMPLTPKLIEWRHSTSELD